MDQFNKFIKNNAVSGFVSSFVVYSNTYPVDVLKVQMQLSKENGVQPKVFTIARNIRAQNGLLGFYKGYGSYIAAYSSFYALYNLCYRGFKNDCGQEIKFVDNNFVDKMIKSNIASTFGSTITNPLQVIKTRVQGKLGLKNSSKINYAQTIREIYADGKLKGFFKGLPATYLNNLKLCIQFPLNDFLIEKKYDKITSATVACIVSSTIFYPFDVIRAKQRNIKTPLSVIGAFESIYNKEGFRGFGRGNLVQMAYSGPNKILTMVLINYINTYNQKH